MYVKSIILENLRGFKNLNFDFERHGGGYAGWTVFVGGNASGKSTLLKGIALALMGPDEGREFGGGQGWISYGASKASVRLKINGNQQFDGFKPSGKLPGPFDAEVRWQLEKGDTVPRFRAAPLPKNKRTDSAHRGPWNPNAPGWFFAGYGPMRRLTGGSPICSGYSARGGVVSRNVTLFREDAALSESEAWLKTNHSRYLEPHNINSKEQIKRLLDGVTNLLNDGLLPHGMKISNITVDHVLVKDFRNIELQMYEISDGCRSIYATILDLVHGMFEVYGIDGLFKYGDNSQVVVDRPGVVLIDEIEAHLHPAWQRDIPEWLKLHFPQVQFLVTTHSPLVAQAADPNGIFVLPSQTDLDREPRPLSAEEFEKLRLGRAEKTLLGSAFGLKSVRSQWANRQIERWRELNAKAKAGATLTKTEQKDFELLKGQMSLAFESVRELETP